LAPSWRNVEDKRLRFAGAASIRQTTEKIRDTWYGKCLDIFEPWVFDTHTGFGDFMKEEVMV